MTDATRPRSFDGVPRFAKSVTDACKNWAGLEGNAYDKLLTSPRLSVYGTAVMDGC